MKYIAMIEIIHSAVDTFWKVLLDSNYFPIVAAQVQSFAVLSTVWKT